MNLSMLAGIAIIGLAAFFAYLPSINGGFVLDDTLFVTGNNFDQTADSLSKIWCTTESEEYYPVSYSTFWIERRLWGMNPTGYHVTNLILHITETLLIWVILRKMSIPGALLAAMLFAIHPVNVESVAWIAQRRNLAAMLFFLLSILWYLKAGMPTASVGMAPAHSLKGPWEREKTFSSSILQPSSFHFWYWLSLAAFLLAMLSKGSAAVLPVLLLGILWWLRSLTKRDLVRIAPFFLLAVAFTVVNIWFQTHGKDMQFRNAGFAERVLGAGCVPWFYLYKALLPIDLAFIYPQWHIEASNPQWWLPLMGALVVTAMLWRYRKGWSRPLLFAWGFFCVSLAPVMGFTDVGFMKYSLVADHYQHIAVIGVVAMAAAAWSIWRERGRNRLHWLTTAVAVAAMAIFAFLTWRQNEIYHDAIGLYQATLQKNPDCWAALNNLGIELGQMERRQEAIEYYRQALRLKPDYADAHLNLGADLTKEGRLQEAIEHYQQALRLKPDYAYIYNNFGAALADAGRTQEAIEHYRHALRLKPDYADAHINLGLALAKEGRLKETIEQYQQALRLKPDYADAHVKMGSALVNAGRLQEAIEHYQQALRLKPDDVDVHIILGVALVNVGRVQEAIEHYQQALRLRPDNAYVHNNLGAALANAGRMQEAIEHYRLALRLKPDYANAHNNLGAALADAGRLQEAIEHYHQALRISPLSINAYYNLALAYAGMKQSSEAIAAAEKGLELARSAGQANLAKKIEDWLNAYRANLSNSPKAVPSSESELPAH
jgi:protein O-mannosyl-transferase